MIDKTVSDLDCSPYAGPLLTDSDVINMGSSPAAEASHYDRVRLANVRRNALAKGATEEVIEGYVIDDHGGCGPRRLMEDKPWSTMFHSDGHITVFLSKLDAHKAVFATKLSGYLGYGGDPYFMKTMSVDHVTENVWRFPSGNLWSQTWGEIVEVV